MELYEIALGIEKIRIRRTLTGRLTPWYWSFVAFMVGIWRASEVCRAVIRRADGRVVLGVGTGWLLACAVLLVLAAILVWRFHGVRRRHYGMAAWLLAWTWFGLVIGAPVPAQLAPTGVPCAIDAQAATGRLPGDSAVIVEVHHWQCGEIEKTGAFLTRLRLADDEVIQRGEGIRALGTFDLPLPADTPGAFDTRAWMRIQNMWLTFQRASTFEHGHPRFTPFERYELDQSWLRRRIDALRLDAHAAMMPDSAYGVSPALSLGVSKTLDDETRQAFATLGIAHVLAVSGLHFGLIAVALTWCIDHLMNLFPRILRRYGRRRATSCLSLALLWLYVLVVGAPISAQRALIMMYACLLGRLDGRKPNSIRNLALAGTLILVIDPNALFQASFQLSLGAVLGIFCTLGLWQEPVKVWMLDHVHHARLRAFLSGLTMTMIMTLGSTLTTAPFAIWHFGQLPFLGSVANLVAIPAVSFVLLPLSLLTAMTASWPVVGHVLGVVSGVAENWFVQAMIWLAHHLPLACLRLPPHGLVLASFSFLAAMTVLSAVPSLWRRYLTRAAIGCAVVVTLVSAIWPRCWFGSHDLRLTFVSMGQADATLIEYPDGTTMLVDAGEPLGSSFDMAKAHLIPYLQYLGIDRIDVVLLTHPDYDHYAALASVVDHVEVGEFWHNGDSVPEDAYGALQNALERHGIVTRDICELADTKVWGEVTFERLWPSCTSANALPRLAKAPGGSPSSALAPEFSKNDQSIVFKLSYGAFSALLTGDAGVAVESRLIDQLGDQLDVTLLKAGHHGSKHSTSEAWLAATTPQFMVYSVGRNNRYHFPSVEVLRRSARFGARPLRTDEQGSIRVTTDGRHVVVESAW